MKPNKQRTEQPTTPAPAPPASQIEQLERGADAHLENLAGILDGIEDAGARVYVYRLHPQIEQARGAPAYVRRYEAPIDIETIRMDLGGGVYRLLVTASDGTMTRKTTIAIDGPVHVARSVQPNPERAPIPHAPAVSTLDELQRFATMARVFRDLMPQAPSITTEALTLARELMALQREPDDNPMNRVLDILPQLLTAKAGGKPDNAASPAAKDSESVRTQQIIERIVQAIRDNDDPDYWAQWIEREAPGLVSLLDGSGIEAARQYLHGLIAKRTDIADPAAARLWCDQVLSALIVDDGDNNANT